MTINKVHSETLSSEEGLHDLVNQARLGDREALGRVLEASRDYLRQVAGSHLQDDLRAKVSVSDLVQDTFIDAQRAFDQFRGSGRGELLAWLRQILINNLLNHYRNYRNTQKRDMAREVTLSAADGPIVYDGDETPSKVCVRREDESLLEQGMKRLTPEHQQVIQWRHQEGLSFPQIGERLDRSADAARMLWYRAFERLSAEIERLT